MDLQGASAEKIAVNAPMRRYVRARELMQDLPALFAANQALFLPPASPDFLFAEDISTGSCPEPSFAQDDTTDTVRGNCVDITTEEGSSASQPNYHEALELMVGDLYESAQERLLDLLSRDIGRDSRAKVKLLHSEDRPLHDLFKLYVNNVRRDRDKRDFVSRAQQELIFRRLDELRLTRHALCTHSKPELTKTLHREGYRITDTLKGTWDLLLPNACKLFCAVRYVWIITLRARYCGKALEDKLRQFEWCPFAWCKGNSGDG